MTKRNFRRPKKSGEVVLPLELQRMSQLEKEFMSSAEVRSLITQRDAMYDEIEAALPERLKPQVLKCADINTDIEVLGIKFFYKHALADRAAITRLLLGKQRLKLDINIL